MRYLLLVSTAVLLTGCAESWEDNGPSALPGGMGVMADGSLAEGSGAVSSISTLPLSNKRGAVPPFSAKGEAAAYEYGSGYRVGAGDKLSIKVAGETDLTGEYVVDPAGLISLPYVQNLQTAGLTTPQIEQHIRTRLQSGYLRNPQVSVQVSASRPFYILGEVSSAGNFPYQAGLTVQNAIAIAGGYAPRADKNEVLLTRRNATGTQTFKVPVTTQLYPGDVVYVRERWF